MIITYDYAKRLIKQGKARCVGHTRDRGALYAVIDRYDLQRTDHTLDEGKLIVADPQI